MADQPPVDPTPAAGVSEPSRIAESADPATLDLPSRWSGAAAVPETGPRRSRWARLWERVSGAEPEPAEPDDWATMPAVDPWADQDTPVWPETFAAETALPAARFDAPAGTGAASQASTGTAAASPPTRQDAVPPPTRLDAAPPPTRLDPAAPYGHAASPAAAKAADAAEKAMADALAAGSKVLDAAKAAAVVAAAKAAEQAAKAGQVAKAGQAAIANQAAKVSQTNSPGQTGSPGQNGNAGQAGSAGQTRGTARPAIPAPGTYPPPAGGTGLPPMRPKLRPWRRAKAPAQPPQTRIPVQPRPAPVRPAPPPWAARPVPPRRRGRVRRWLRRMTLLTVLGLVLCCGGPLAYWQFPVARQHPVSAVLPDSFADLDLRDTAAGQRAAERLAEQLQEAGSAGDAFAGTYADGRGKRVTVFGVTGWRLTPGSDVDTQLDRLTSELKLKDVQSYDVGEFGVHERCGVGRLNNSSVVACAWADHGSLATVLLTRRSIEESAELVAGLRSVVLTPKYWS
ncbi:hypothetical protein [Actinoplanes aureus]|uniref:Uncharacterized protein n=1 Tax=Actinoplanes aureus TaxID=2792083 RepID=A0A931G320_9ACTN|nr:hypothetical protein [Actinoplanes aureus]MBG0568770.1 hypothetical protein [Actinoplanes aureus]